MARRKPPIVNGVVLIDKPAGLTSHDVVARLRKRFSERRIGHAGTLDPDATGLLVVGVGKATRLLRFATEGVKHYTTEIHFGVETSTLDAAGEVTARHDMDLDPERVRAAVRSLTGRISQVPPMVSAIRVDGRRLHELAREGVEVEREARLVDVHEFVVIPTDDPIVWRAEVRCGPGTYIRSLAADLGAALGGGAHIDRLRRIGSGSFTVDEAGSIDDAPLMPVATMVRDMSAVEVDDAVATRVLNGVAIGEELAAGEGPWAVFGADGTLLAVHERTDGKIKPAVVIPA